MALDPSRLSRREFDPVHQQSGTQSAEAPSAPRAATAEGKGRCTAASPDWRKRMGE
jgi:hypothetical protein